MATATYRDLTMSVWLSSSPVAGAGRESETAIVLTPPGAGAPAGEARLTCPSINAEAYAKVRGTAGEDVTRWRFGFVQLKLITDDWAHYRGPTASDGSVFVALDRPPARPQQLCRDTYIPGARGPNGLDMPFFGPPIFYDGDAVLAAARFGFAYASRQAGILPAGTTIPANGSLTVGIHFSDQPTRSYPLVENNGSFVPARQNFLYSIYTGAAFATMFAVQKGYNQKIEVLKNFLWNVRWRAHFRRNAAGNIVQLPPKDPGEMRLNVSAVQNGEPNDPRFKNSITAVALPTCNTVVQGARAAPVRRTSQRWEDFDVRHPPT